MWDPIGVVRYVSRIIQDANHGSEIYDTTSDSDGDDEEAEKIKTERAFLEFEGKTLELNLALAEHGDLERSGTEAALGPLKRYYEERFSGEMRKPHTPSGKLYRKSII
jgi:hypothetical protein